MPTYVYECRKCGHRFEVFHSMTEKKPRKCPKCGGRAVKVPAAGAGLLFKGSGFYITDYRSSSYKEGAKSEGSSGKSEGSTSSKTGDSGSKSEGSSSSRAGDSGSKSEGSSSSKAKRKGGRSSRKAES
jgi:putative FmdB family regulatory protein